MCIRDSACCSCGEVSDSPAVCLVCGATVCAGSCMGHERHGAEEGSCTTHARSHHQSRGIFFLLRENMVVILRGVFAAYRPSVYVDAHGEDVRHIMGGKHRPLYLDDSRYAELNLIWSSYSCGLLVAQLRSTSDRVIKRGWF